MRHRSLKRARQERKYLINRNIFIQKRREKDKYGRLFCFFCTKQIHVEPDCHHTNGRDEDLLLKESLWELAHNKCHVQEYHGTSCLDILWWPEYIVRIQNTHPDLYQRELRRQEKAEYGKNRDCSK